jgi:hypothetical protein
MSEKRYEYTPKAWMFFNTIFFAPILIFLIYLLIIANWKDIMLIVVLMVFLSLIIITYVVSVIISKRKRILIISDSQIKSKHLGGHISKINFEDIDYVENYYGPKDIRACGIKIQAKNGHWIDMRWLISFRKDQLIEIFNAINDTNKIENIMDNNGWLKLGNNSS